MKRSHVKELQVCGRSEMGIRAEVRQSEKLRYKAR
jgi:hypothetical protein